MLTIARMKFRTCTKRKNFNIKFANRSENVNIHYQRLRIVFLLTVTNISHEYIRVYLYNTRHEIMPETLRTNISVESQKNERSTKSAIFPAIADSHDGLTLTDSPECNVYRQSQDSAKRLHDSCTMDRQSQL